MVNTKHILKSVVPQGKKMTHSLLTINRPMLFDGASWSNGRQGTCIWNTMEPTEPSWFVATHRDSGGAGVGELPSMFRASLFKSPKFLPKKTQKSDLPQVSWLFPAFSHVFPQNLLTCSSKNNHHHYTKSARHSWRCPRPSAAQESPPAASWWPLNLVTRRDWFLGNSLGILWNFSGIL